ncbi:MAG: ABC transporter substrate-binding protein [Oscillospiraceae bacterium]|nr:ABC transporter substrate-binding protein [Oscillospiraceae bacterium]
MKKLFALLLLLAVLLAGCSVGNGSGGTPAASVFNDALSRAVPIQSLGRVVAGSGSLAELWLLAGGSLAGATDDAFDGHFALPENVENIGKLHQISMERLTALSPELMILSAEIPSQTKLQKAFEDAGVPAIYISVESFGDYLNVLRDFTRLTGRAELYRTNGLALKAEIDAIRARVPADAPPKVLLLRANSTKVEARSSSSLAGIMLQDMGCENIADSDAGILENLSMEIILRENPDYIFVVFQGENEVAAQNALAESLTKNPAWARLAAVKNDRLIFLPKELFHQKPNASWPKAYEKLWEILYAQE